MSVANTSRSFAEWQAQAQMMRAMADRSRASRRTSLERTLRAAGLDFSTLHNAMVGLHYGKPWRGVDYSMARKAQRQQAQLFEASRIVERWHARVWKEVVR